MKLVNIGFGNMINANRLITIVSPESAPELPELPAEPHAVNKSIRITSVIVRIIFLFFIFLFLSFFSPIYLTSTMMEAKSKVAGKS